MFAGFYTFEQVLQGVKGKTGLTNMRNLYEDIRNFMCAAEREINPYAGHLALKKMIVYKDTITPGGLYDGEKIKKPFDYVSLHQMQTCNVGLCRGQYYETVSHFVMCNNGKPPRPFVKFVYWAYQSDENGNPITTMNHAEAVEEYIVLMLKRQKNFLGQLGLQEIRDQEQRWFDRLHEARGEDFFPDDDQLLEIARTNHAEKVQLFNIIPGIDGCYEMTCMRSYSEQEGSDLPPINTPPTISDNSAIYIPPLYIFKYPDFIKDYFDLQNHPPGKAIIKGDIDNRIGKLVYEESNSGGSGFAGTPTINIPIIFPFEIPFSNITKLKLRGNKNVLEDDGRFVIYPGVEDINATILDYTRQGYEMSKDNYDYIFRKEVQIGVTVSTNIYIFLDRTSMNIEDAQQISASLLDWFSDYKIQYDNFEGQMYIIPTFNEKWLSLGSFPWNGMVQIKDPNNNGPEELLWDALSVLPPMINNPKLWVKQDDAIVIALIDETFPEYHAAKLTDGFYNNITQPSFQYVKDYNEFRDIYNNNYTYFKGLLYPIIRDTKAQSASLVLQAIAALEAKILTQSEINSYNTPIDISDLLFVNPYQDYSLTGYPKLRPLKGLGWKGIFDKVSNGEQIFDRDTLYGELDSMISTEVQTYIDIVRIEGELVDTELNFPFSVKEFSNDQLESLDHIFSFNLKSGGGGGSSDDPVTLRMWSFQFYNLTLNINDVDLIDDIYLENEAEEHTETSLLAGKTIQYFDIGRIGFAIQKEIPGTYNIFDILGNNITNSVFDKVFDAERKIEIFVSKEYYIPGETYFKFIKD